MTKSAAPSKLLDRGLALSTSAEGPAAQPAPLVATSKRKRAEEEAQIGDSQPAALEQAVETMSSVSVEATTEVTPAASENAVEAAADAGAASEAAESDRAAVMPWAKVALGGLGLVGAVAAAAGGDSKSSPSPQVPTGQEPGPSGEEPTGAGGETPAKPAPVAPTLEISGSNGTVNAEGGVKIGGLNPGHDWEYSLDGGKTWHPGKGDGVPADALTEGKNELIVVAVDKDGTRSEPAAIEITKDTQIAAPSVEGSNGTGPINGSGSITVGGIETGGKWDFSLDGGKTWTPGTGDSIPADALAEGDNHVTVRQTDPAGNQATSEINVAKDTTIEQPTLTPSNGTGPINGSGSITVGGIETGGKWDFSLDGGKTWVHGNGSTISADALAEGSNQVTVRHIDAAGNVATAACTVILDTAVAKPTLVMDDASVGPEKLGQNVVVGNLEAGATWEWRVHTSSGYSDWITGTGDQIATSLLPQNTVFAVWVRQTDLAGNQASSYLLGMMDTLAPEAPALQLAVDTGVSGTDSLTNNAQINVSGLEMGARWDFSLDNGATWTAGVGTSIASSALQEGANTVLVRQTDGAGNASAVTSISVTKDTQVAVPGVGTSTGTALIDVGDTLSISGIESGATWEYSLDGGSIWTAGTGMSINAESLNHGKNSVAIRQTDAAGNVATSDALIVTRNDPTPSVRLHNYENSDQSTYFVGDRDVTVHVVRADRAVATLDDLRDLGSAYGTMSTNSTGQAYVDGLENGAYRFYVASASGKLNEVHYANAGMTDVAATRLVVGGFGSFITMGSKVGSAGDDTMTGYLGVLTGGSGADTFRATDAGYLRLFLGDYNRAEGDVLDLSAVLSGATVDNLSGFLSKQVGANGQITLLLDASGTGNFQSDKFFVTLLNNHVAQDIALKLAGGSTAVI